MTKKSDSYKDFGNKDNNLEDYISKIKNMVWENCITHEEGAQIIKSIIEVKYEENNTNILAKEILLEKLEKKIGPMVEILKAV